MLQSSTNRALPIGSTFKTSRVADVDVKLSVSGVGALFPYSQEIVASGPVTVFNGDVVAFTISDGGVPDNFKLEVQLIDEMSGETTIEQVPQNNGMRVVLKNVGFQPSIASTSKIPIQLTPGALYQKLINLNFAVQSVGTARILHYTLSR